MIKPKFIQPVIIAVIRKENKYLLTKRAVLDEEDLPEFKSQWELPGGGMEPGETPEEALLREVKEELSIKVNILSSFPFIFTKMRNQWQGLFLCYICEPIDDSPIKLNEESSDYKWVTKEETTLLKTLPGVVEVIDAFIKVKR
jgi:8-oxo-dGTP diphosphatase